MGKRLLEATLCLVAVGTLCLVAVSTLSCSRGQSDCGYAEWRDDEALHVTRLSGIETYLPGHIVVATLGWNDFILRNKSGELLRLPTIPLVQKYAEKLPSMPDASRLIASPEHTGKIKWYVKPLLFGGDPDVASNVEWADMQRHQKPFNSGTTGIIKPSEVTDPSNHRIMVKCVLFGLRLGT